MIPKDCLILCHISHSISSSFYSLLLFLFIITIVSSFTRRYFFFQFNEPLKYKADLYSILLLVLLFQSQ